MGKKITTSEIIQRVKEVHGDKYDCSKIQYVNSSTPIILICPKHGDFKYYVGHLREKRGCPICSKGGNTNDFIEKARKIHGSKYDYSKAKYTGRHQKLIIICPIHGEFRQEAGSHLSGHGCPKCGSDSMKFKQRKSLDKFIEKSNEIHNNKYDYLKTNYVNNSTKVEIICPKHGSFWQRPDAHLIGQGCPKCECSKGETLIESYLKQNNIKFIPQHKIPIDKSINSSGITKIDFYLPNYNLFIEYNGKQHYVPIKYFGGQITFEHQQKRDQYVRNYCKKNSIKLLEIRYDEDIEKILYENLNDDCIQSISCQ